MSKKETDANHLWHVWINQRQEENRKEDPKREHEHSLYEFKSMLEFLTHGHIRIQEAFEGKLPVKHQQCSLSSVEPINNNVLKCSLEGTDVTQCPILLGIKKVFEDHAAKDYQEAQPEVFKIMANTCAWHTYHKNCNVTDKWGGVDTSMGYLMDESDRMFWSRVHENMSSFDGIEED